jgi:hypothetical protein
MPEIHEAASHALYVPRKGEVNAWDNAAFVQTVRETGKKSLVIAGVWTSNRILLLDTCYAGAATLGSRAEDLWNAQAPGGRAIMLCASGPNQRAREGPNHGALTGQLLASLRKAADRATDLDLFDVITTTHSSFVGTLDQNWWSPHCTSS